MKSVSISFPSWLFCSESRSALRCFRIPQLMSAEFLPVSGAWSRAIRFRQSDHGLVPKSAVQFTTRVSGVLGLATPRLVTNRLPSGATSYQQTPCGTLKRACSL